MSVDQKRKPSRPLVCFSFHLPNTRPLLPPLLRNGRVSVSRSTPVLRGIRELRRLVRDQTFDLRTLDPAGFRRWLDLHLAHWLLDPVFNQRSRIRDLRRAHPELAALEKEYRRAATEDEMSPEFARLCRLEQEVIDAGKAVAGLTAAREGSPPERKPGLEEKLQTFQVKRDALEQEQAALVRRSSQRQDRLRIQGELQQFRAAIGLDREEEYLAKLQKEQGRQSGRAGESFEQLALHLAESYLVPEWISSRSGPSVRPPRVLRAVTLGAARTELDQLVIRESSRRSGPAEVLAMVEVKRNINDLAWGFRQRQENLAWLTGDRSGYDPLEYRTGRFPFGHFDREAVHEQDGEEFVLSPASFRRFRREHRGFFLNRLCLVTREGTLWGVSAAVLARIRFRAGTDQRWEPDNDAYLRRFHDWCRSLAEPVETPDVLELYASAPRRARQILLVGRGTSQ